MTDEEQANLEAEKQGDGGETVETKTTEKTPEELKQIAEDQRKRAEKAEAKNKELEAKVPKSEPKPEPNKSINAQADPDELRLIAKGLSDEEIEQAKVVSKGKGISLLESLKDPLFVSFQKDLKEQEKKEKAKLGASKSSNQGQEEEKSEFDTGITREGTEKHKEAWKKALGR